MAAGLNLHIAIGHLGDDATLRYTQKPVPVTSFRIACGERYRDAKGNWQEHAEWVNCVLFGKRAEGLNKYLVKGTRVCVVGSQRTRSYEKNGQKRWITETRLNDVVLLSTPEGKQIQNEGSAIGKAVAGAMAGQTESTDPNEETDGAPAHRDADAPEDFS